MSPEWFNQTGRSHFDNYLEEFKGKSGLNFLQIGVLTGDASVWLAENILAEDSYLHDVDTWLGSPGENYGNGGLDIPWDVVEKEYDDAVAKYPNVIKYKTTSADFLLKNTIKYDFIYIDGDHTAAGVITDSVLAYQHLKPGGIIAWDDLQWAGDPEELRRPFHAINFFTWAHQKELDLLVATNQAWFRRKHE
jgi:hypothetical protein